eukprot:11781380-Alexandrium_andersonii.AAC.1
MCIRDRCFTRALYAASCAPSPGLRGATAPQIPPPQKRLGSALWRSRAVADSVPRRGVGSTRLECRNCH